MESAATVDSMEQKNMDTAGNCGEEKREAAEDDKKTEVIGKSNVSSSGVNENSPSPQEQQQQQPAKSRKRNFDVAFLTGASTATGENNGKADSGI